MSTSQFRLGFERKIGYSFIGLLAGNLATLAGLSISSALAVLPADLGQPASSLQARLTQGLGVGTLFGIVSLVSWVVIGIPLILSLSANLTTRLHWSLTPLIGAVLGASALAILFTSLDGWHRTLARVRDPHSLPIYLTFLAVAVIIAGVAFSVYCALVRRASRHEQRKSGVSSRTPHFFSVF